MTRATKTGKTQQPAAAGQRPESGAAKAGWRPRAARRSVQAVGSFVPGITRAAFERFGFASAALISDWPRIVGEELAYYCAPQKLKWPRRFDVPPDDQSAVEVAPGATLTMRVEGARALEVQYAAAQIIERINAFFGYRAVERIRIVQGPVAKARPRAAPARPEHRSVAMDETGDQLTDALARLQAARAAAQRR